MKEMIYIGIGASAGGLNALQKFVALLPENSNTIYIIAQHLLPDKKSSLADILSHHTQLSVTEIEPSIKFHSNHIYVIPPGCNLILKKHRLVLERSESLPHHATPSVDILFESMAGYAGKNSVGILLSGTGHDGTKGMKQIKEAGGVTIAQSPDEAQHKGMPQSAIDAEVVDHVHNVEEIAANLFHLLSRSVTETSMHDLTPLESIHALLRTQERLDLSKYKEETILRRINKRMMFLHLSDINAYAEYLAAHHDEAHLLYQDILIGVTSFFRDPESFTALETSLTEVLQKRPDHSEFRIWCVACASGEEAYTLAIVISEISKRLDKTFDVRIFATDIDDVSLAKARLAEYSRESLEEMDPALLALYFSPTENGYKVNQSLRQNIVFTHHNLLQDPPFINQDLISCRNFLIYILPTAQKEIFALFHYALKLKGLLFLGSSESTLLSLNYFTPMDPQHKIYEKEALQNPPKISNHYFSKHLDQIVDRRASSISSMGTTTIDEEISKAIFNFFAPHCVIVDRNYTMVYKKGDIPVLRLGDGIPSLNLLHNLDELLRYDVKSLMDRAFVSKSYEVSKFIEISASQESTLFIRAVAYPFEDIQNTPMLMLYFQELGSNDLQFNTAALHLPNESMMLKNLNAQLMTTREELRFLSDELILSKETTQLMNEELQSSNEELQSSNEELETSNEELQSSNEELHASLSHIEKLQNHLTLIFNSSFDGIMGLDIHARHTFVNVAAAQMLGYTPDELIGKDSHKLWHHTKLDGTYFPEEECPTIKVLTEGENRRAEDLFWRKDGTSFEVELLQAPIIENEKIIGAVLSFQDITQRKENEELLRKEVLNSKLLTEELKTEKLQLQHVLEFAPIPIMIHDENENIIFINRALEKSAGYLKEELPTMGIWLDKLYPDANTVSKKQFIKCYERSTGREQKEHVITTKSGEKRVWLISSVELDALQKGTSITISSVVDITEVQRKDEIMISQSRQAAMGDMLAMIAHQWRQPLSVIAMSTNTLKAHLELEEVITPDILRELIETINKQAHYLSHTIDDFRDFFKPDKVKEKIAISVILERLVTLIEKGLENNSITLELPKNQKIELLTYPNELLQALINIINNAKDAIKEKHPVGGLIRITLNQNNGEMVIEICDNGGGIASSVDKHLGDPYVTTKASNGTGLGLYMTKIIITKHLDGRLWWSSDSNGSCFSIALPTGSEGA